ncbi:aspartate aminotransferase-like enzyme [Bacillus thermophilus]|uniref:Aspartate aminotransferase-like enzyme n=1 Tax=Siminovitchia thermophila TaxID=1245522 RepID=A0ABS2R3A9_9BACI|nr:alanine--glyoxylate aminotransferase family protein [Siminovitchia thermophila]MBM7713116.1 aspartate aminotransferase-like enzyme [Siminovitchia thermophila]ONK24851.1 class V aminotransferase [Bacillus sp. VT-16-64]
MFLDKEYLFTPGPTPIPDRVKIAMNQPMIGHRGAAFPVLLEDVATRLQPVFGADNPVLIISGSGTGALETAAVNVIDPGDDVVVIVGGAFGDRFAKICEAHGANVHKLEVEWGTACQPEQLEDFIKSLDANVKAVFATYCETSTSIIHPIKQLGEVTKRLTDGLFIVDGVSCIGGVPADMAGWNIDILVSGSQKALMLPPGLAFVAVSDHAKEAIQKTKNTRFYFDLNRYFDNYDQKKSTPFTPAISLIYGAQEVCNMIDEEGWENVIKRHELLKTMTREGVKALGIPLLTNDKEASPTVTAVMPKDDQANAIRKIMKDKYHISLAGGQQKLSGKIFRIGHMGYCNPYDVLTVLAALEMTIKEMENKDVLGLATKRAQEVWAEHV